jgi:DNA mismatch endonuclease (patch repair protein)
VDTFTPQERSEIMRRVKGRDTSPERIVRRVAHRLGYRFRLNRKDLPGCPDVVFPSRRKALFVHGCFWHQHPGCKRARIPSSNRAYWRKKLARNCKRDVRSLKLLRDIGWKPLVVWECQIGDPKRLAAKLDRFLSR